MKDFRLSPHFWYSEAIRTDHRGIDNTPSDAILDKIRWTANCMEEVRARLAAPILPNSWYRCPELNQRVGGSPTSEHMDGRAVDIRVPAYGDAFAVCRAIADMDIAWNQLIYEHTWTHISFPPPGVEPKREVLTYMGRGRYQKGIVRK